MEKTLNKATKKEILVILSDGDYKKRNGEIDSFRKISTIAQKILPAERILKIKVFKMSTLFFPYYS